MLSITNLVVNASLNAKSKIPSITNLATNTEYTTTPEFNKLAAENFTARLNKQM